VNDREKGVRHGLGQFDLGDPASRKNSASIRRFLYDMVASEFERSPAKAAKALTQALNEAEDQRAYRRRGFTENTVYNVLTDRRTITFNELDSLGLYYGVPLALVVIFTQGRSEMKSFGKARAQQTLRAFREAVGKFEALLDDIPEKLDAYGALPHETFKQIRGCYLDAFDDYQPRLALTHPG
jgi:hypothetical protein